MIEQLFGFPGYFPFFNFFLGYLAATIVIICQLNKRRYWGIPICIVVAAYVAVGLLFWHYGIRLRGKNVLISICGIYYIIMTLLLFACCRVSFIQALFCSTCSYISEHLGAVISKLLQRMILLLLGIKTSDLLMHIIVYAIVFAVLHFTVFQSFRRNGKVRIRSVRILTISLFLFLAASVLYSNMIFSGSAENRWIIYYGYAYDMLFSSCFLILLAELQKSKRFEEDLEIAHLLRQRQAEQYLISRDNIALIERKCHDIKHQVAALRSVDDPEAREASIRELEQAVAIYGAMMKTGNDVLDTVLTDKYLFCEQQGITWTCIADGSKLDFMDPIDLYILFANALDNSIEAVQKIQNPEQRTISVLVYTRFNMAFLQIENFFNSTIELKDNLPKSTKQSDGYHGYGLQSIQHTVEKYSGSMQIQTENQIFVLHIAIPLP